MTAASPPAPLPAPQPEAGPDDGTVHGFEALDEARAATEAAAAEAAADPAAQALAKTRSVRGKRFIIALNVLIVLVVAVNYVAATRNRRIARERSADAALVADVARADQAWMRLPDGMTLAASVRTAGLTAEQAADGTKRVRRHLRHQRAEYLRANYADPRFGTKDIPGRADLEFGTSHHLLNVRYRDIPGGGELRWMTKDPIMLDSLNEWAKKVGTSPPSGP